ncbi:MULTISPECIES: signal peptidase I [unclassified Streptomyces]|uniref:signal peptidase I n=1 Tax=unclassified Streptomyces TaxID=2593676 RepID=UPI0006AF0F50|nr:MULTISPECIES: signal peptidase I [unclassified Streptomyces]KOX35783.1 peptidase S26 [Streptomyces sp. NRRL F-6491]KOX41353.1 peptidase S26 [Streptomyces sp. NRRL F-6492]
MDTEAQHTERGPSSDTDPDRDSGTEEGPRSARVSGHFEGSEGSEDSGHSEDSEDSAGGPSWRRTALLGGACVAFLLLLSHFVVQPFLIPSRSMEPTLRVGDRILVNRLAYRFGDEPRRGDVVVFDGTGSFVREEAGGDPVTGPLRDAAAALGLAEPAETDFVKRVVGTGGDRVVCCDKDGRLTVNGTTVVERYLMPGDPPSGVPFDIVVPADRLWVMGDHRSQSSDSRDHLGSPGGGMVPVEKVVGRADWIAWPFGRWTGVAGTDAFDAVPAPPAGGHPTGPGGGGAGTRG